MTTTPSVQRVAVALFEGFTVLDVYGPVQAFASCRVVQPDGQAASVLRGLLDGAEAGRVKAGEGPASWAEWSFEKAPDYDILLDPGGFGTPRGGRRPVVRRAVSPPASRRARVTTTVCTGSALLAYRAARRSARDVEQDRWDWVTSRARACSGSARPLGRPTGNIVTSSGVSAGSTWRWRSSPACTARDGADRGEEHGVRLARARGGRSIRVSRGRGGTTGRSPRDPARRARVMGTAVPDSRRRAISRQPRFLLRRPLGNRVAERP